VRYDEPETEFSQYRRPCLENSPTRPHRDRAHRDLSTAVPFASRTPTPLNENAVKDHEYFVYIVSSRSGTLYIGMTNSIYRRALQHKRGEIEGFASKYHCNRLVYHESFDDVHKAIGREKQLKGWTRAKKIALIESKNPRWEDLAEKWGAQMVFAGESIKAR
jgi:putative endonuclease